MKKIDQRFHLALNKSSELILLKHAYSVTRLRYSKDAKVSAIR